MKNRLATGALMSTAIFLLTTMSAWAETLKTRNFKVRITRNCPKGSVVCNNVSYYGTHLRTGQSVQLTGRTLHAPCKGGKAACRFLGYQSQKGSYRCFVTADGTLQVYQGKKLLIQEKGTWAN